jgi:hypothetical protein
MFPATISWRASLIVFSCQIRVPYPRARFLHTLVCSSGPNHPGDPGPDRPQRADRRACWDSNVSAPLPRRRRRRARPRYASAFDGMTLFAHAGRPEITGPIIDPSHLHGLLDRITGLGLTVHSLTPLDSEDAPADSRTHIPPALVADHDPGANSKGPRRHDLPLDSGGRPVGGVLDLLRADHVPQRALPDVLDRILHPDPMDHRRPDRPTQRAAARAVPSGA